MSERRNDWASPGTLIGVVGLFGAGVSAYTSLSDRASTLEESRTQVERRLQRVEDKIDHLIYQTASGKADK
jgi:thiamine monophosphate kinase